MTWYQAAGCWIVISVYAVLISWAARHLIRSSREKD
jgi:SNF family Na+-dependent transporter